MHTNTCVCETWQNKSKILSIPDINYIYSMCIENEQFCVNGTLRKASFLLMLCSSMDFVYAIDSYCP